MLMYENNGLVHLTQIHYDSTSWRETTTIKNAKNSSEIWWAHQFSYGGTELRTAKAARTVRVKCLGIWTMGNEYIVIKR